jgi:hypothetical protein
MIKKSSNTAAGPCSSDQSFEKAEEPNSTHASTQSTPTADEKACTNRTTNGDHLHVPALQGLV